MTPRRPKRSRAAAKPGFAAKSGSPGADPLEGLTPRMRDALEIATRSMLAFFDDGVRAQCRADRPLCSAGDMRKMLGCGLFEPLGDGDCVRLTRAGLRAAAVSAHRRARFARYRAQQQSDLIEGRRFLQRLADRRSLEAAALATPERQLEGAPSSESEGSVPPPARGARAPDSQPLETPYI